MHICPICKAKTEFTTKRDYRNSYGNFTLYECLRCKAQFWTPLKSLGAEWYAEKNTYAIHKVVPPRVSRAYHIKFLYEHGTVLNDKVILDIGCGSGEFLAELQKRGADVWGLDFDPTAIEIAKKYFHLRNVFQMSIEEFLKKSDIPKFDMITIFEVLQYIEDPLSFARLIKGLIKPTGKIYISVPERERMLANFDQWDFPPNHLTRWNNKSLESLFEKADFEIVNLTHLEELKMLMGSVNGRFRFGLMKRAAVMSQSKQVLNSPSKFLHIFARIKEYMIGFIPAASLFLWSKLIGKKNGTIFIELHLK